MKIYLAGRTAKSKRYSTTKFDILPAAPKSQWFASDPFPHEWTDYAEHGWDFDGKPHDEPSSDDRKDMVRSIAIPLIHGCDLMVAYVNDPYAYGTIAEIAYASALGKSVIFLIDLGDDINEERSDYNALPVDHKDDRKWYMTPMMDAYWFTASLPNVFARWAHDAAYINSDEWDLGKITTNIDAIESPIEMALFAHFDPYLWGDAVRTQYRVGKYRLDFAFPDKKLAVECDGHAYHSTRDQRGRDADRDRELIAQGWTVIRFTGSQIHENPERCADEVKRILYTRAATA